MKKYFIVLTLAILATVTQPAYAESPFTLQEGWNLVSAEIVYSLDIDNLINSGGALFLLNPDDKKYYGGSGNSQAVKDDIEKVQSRPRGDNIIGLGFWVYTPKVLISQLDFAIPEDRIGYYKESYNFIKGWNFVAITSLMKGKAIGDVSGTCKLTTAYVFERGAWQKQTDADLKEKFTDDSLGHAMAIKVENDCAFNFDKASQKQNIPALPN